MTSRDGHPLPLHLLATEPMELDQLPLQVALLTMEVASLRERMAVTAELCRALAEALTLPTGDLMTGFGSE